MSSLPPECVTGNSCRSLALYFDERANCFPCDDYHYPRTTKSRLRRSDGLDDSDGVSLGIKYQYYQNTEAPETVDWTPSSEPIPGVSGFDVCPGDGNYRAECTLQGFSWSATNTLINAYPAVIPNDESPSLEVSWAIVSGRSRNGMRLQTSSTRHYWTSGCAKGTLSDFNAQIDIRYILEEDTLQFLIYGNPWDHGEAEWDVITTSPNIDLTKPYVVTMYAELQHLGAAGTCDQTTTSFVQGGWIRITGYPINPDLPSTYFWGRNVTSTEVNAELEFKSLALPLIGSVGQTFGHYLGIEANRGAHAGLWAAVQRNDELIPYETPSYCPNVPSRPPVMPPGQLPDGEYDPREPGAGPCYGLVRPTLSQGTSDFGIRRTSVATSLANQVQTFNARRDTVTLTYDMTNDELSSWLVWHRANGWKWFIIDLISPYEPRYLVSERTCRLIGDITIRKLGDNWNSLAVPAEILPADNQVEVEE